MNSRDLIGDHPRPHGIQPPAAHAGQPSTCGQRADYARDGRYYKLDALAEIDAAETAIARLEGADVQHRRSFTAHVLFKRQP